MKKFLVIFHSQTSPSSMPALTPEQMKGMMDFMMAWSAKCGAGMVDLGMPLNPSAQRVTGQGVMTINSTETGYSILQADDMAGAVKLLDGLPMMQAPGQSIVVHELAPMPGM